MCKNFPTIGRKGIGTEGRKDHEDPMARGAACIIKEFGSLASLSSLPLPSAVGAISPASFEHEYPGKAGLFWVRHEHMGVQNS
jgi:hypothetical protein